MSSSIYARDPITKAYKEITAVETSPGIWGLSISGSAGGGGGGDASAANQATQIGLETSIRNSLLGTLSVGLDAASLAALENTTVAISGTATVTEAPPTAISHAVVDVPSAGTRVQLAAFPCKSVVIKALAANTGTIYVGGGGVTAANGFPLAAGDTLSVDISNTNLIYIDTSVSGSDIAWMANV